MPDLRQHLETLTGTTVHWVGLGNPVGGDDAAGVRLAESLISANVPHVVVAGLQPELAVAEARIARPEHVVFLDATEFGANPGAVTFLDAARIQSRFPQISTHRLSLSTLSRMLLAEGVVGVWLLGIQPASLRSAHALTPTVQLTVNVLSRLILDCLISKPHPGISGKTRDGDFSPLRNPQPVPAANARNQPLSIGLHEP